MVRTAELAASLAPSRLAIFGYAHAPWFAKRQQLIDAAALPGAAERLRQAATARADPGRARAMSPSASTISRLPDDPMAIALRAGKLRRNFQGYTVDQADALLPFGASSIGRLPQGYVQNAADVGVVAPGDRGRALRHRQGRRLHARRSRPRGGDRAADVRFFRRLRRDRGKHAGRRRGFRRGAGGFGATDPGGRCDRRRGGGSRSPRPDAPSCALSRRLSTPICRPAPPATAWRSEARSGCLRSAVPAAPPHGGAGRPADRCRARGAAAPGPGRCGLRRA